MEVGVPTPVPRSNGHMTSKSSSSRSSSNLSTSSSSSRSPSTPNKHVNFGGNGVVEEKKREKFLTAKYGAHQMALIRKRLRVEMWMYDRLQEIYGADEIEIDLDEVLDMDAETDRRQYIYNLLREAKASKETLNLFVGDLLERVKTL